MLVHGGAGVSQRKPRKDALKGVRAALDAGWRALAGGGSALDAVEAAVVVLEDNETFNAGRGSCLTADGRVQMDALIMDGATLDAGAVACVERLCNPIRAARKILAHSPHVLFAGPDAERLAEQLGLPLCDSEELITDRQRKRLAATLRSGPLQGPHRASPSPTRTANVGEEQLGDTVGAVALDAAGNLAAGTSTGGMAGKAPGRVGDSPLVGCGGYADNEAGAASTTGWGEPIMRLVLAKWAVDQLQAGESPDRAARLAVEHLERRLRGSGGLIVIARDGRYGVACNTPAMPWGVKTAEQELVEAGA